MSLMEKSTSNIQVGVEGDEIVVMGTVFLLAYRKPFDLPHLVLTRSRVAPTTAAPAIIAFRAQAFEAANSKARELGWIVSGPSRLFLRSGRRRRPALLRNYAQ